MRHRKGYKKLNRPTDQRMALLRSLASGVILDGKITTTLAKAKAVRPYLERLVTKGVKGYRLDEAAKQATDEEERKALTAQSIHLRRIVRKKLQDPRLVNWLFTETARAYVNRPGGYTRITKIGHRRGDATQMAILEFV